MTTQSASAQRRAEIRRLRDEDGLTFAEIGHRLGIGASAAASAYRYQPSGGVRGVKPRPVDVATLPPVARVLYRGLACPQASVAAATWGIPATAVRWIYDNRGTEPYLSTVATILRAIRPDDADGGWAWFGGEMAAESTTSNKESDHEN